MSVRNIWYLTKMLFVLAILVGWEWLCWQGGTSILLPTLLLQVLFSILLPVFILLAVWRVRRQEPMIRELEGVDQLVRHQTLVEREFWWLMPSSWKERRGIQILPLTERYPGLGYFFPTGQNWLAWFLRLAVYLCFVASVVLCVYCLGQGNYDAVLPAGLIAVLLGTGIWAYSPYFVSFDQHLNIQERTKKD